MSEQVFVTISKLSKVIQDIQTFLQCRICLHTISEPVKILCGHRFCRTCIQTVLQNKNALCPLCNTSVRGRAISTDEETKNYVDQLHQLTRRIQTDSGIDVSSHMDESRAAKENHSPVATSHRRPEKSQSSMDLSFKKNEEHRAYRNVRKQRETSKESKSKKRNSGNSDILRYLTKYSISGVGPLSTDTTDDFEDVPKEDNNSKVHSWLNALPETTEAFEDPDKISPEQPAEFNLDDTLTMSASQGCKDNKLVDCEAEEQPRYENPLRSSLPNNYKDNEKEVDPSRSSETRSHSSKTVLLDDLSDPRPSTSGMRRSSEECKERSSTDVQRTSPCDMLPIAKRNWSSVVQFGKEMRAKRRKKFKSLNVSKSRSHEETVVDETSKLRGAKDERKEKESSVPSGVLKDPPRRKSIESSKDPEVPRDMVRKTKKSLPNVEERRKSTEESTRSTPINIAKDTAKRSNLDKNTPNAEEKGATRSDSSDEVHIIGESSFIVLEDEEQVHIRNLNSYQVNDIIGIMVDDIEDHPEALDDKDQAESTLPLKKRRNMSHASPSKLPIQATPKKMATYQSSWDTMNESTFKCQSVTSQASNRGRLSLNRHSTDRKSNDSSSSNSVSRLSSARRDLNRQIDESINNDITESIAEDGRRENRSIFNRIEKDKGDRSLVKFRKLGKVYKRHKKPVRFLYLGSTRRKSLFHERLGISHEKPCNLVDYWETQCDENINTLENTFGNNLHITVNDPMKLTRDNPEDLTVQKAAKEVTIEQNAKESAVEKSCTLNAVLTSLDKNEEETGACVKSSSAKMSQNTVSKSTVKLMSPSNDSQLRYLSCDSPPGFVISTPKSDHIETIKATDNRKNNSSEVKGGHSRAPFREASNSSENDSHCDLATKKRSKNENKDAPGTRKRCTDGEDDGFESERSFSSATTCLRGLNAKTNLTENEKVSSAKSAIESADVVSLSSDSDILNDNLGDQRKIYKRSSRVAPLISSDTDSPNLAVNKSKDSTDSPSPKRKRTESPDFDCDVALETLVKDWYEDLNISDKKDSKSEQSRAKVPKGYKAPSGSTSVKIQSSRPGHLSDFTSKVPAEGWDKMVRMDEDSPDFAATIDKIQHLRKNASATGNGDNKQADKEVTMTDNFNELNFDTNAFDDYFETYDIKPALNQDEPDATGSSSARPLNKDAMIMTHRSSSSDKENKYKGGRMARGSDSDDDITVIKDNERNDRAKPLELSSDQLKRNRTTDYEQDSLMNITQHDLLIKQLETDLFGKPLLSSSSFGSKGQDQKTPEKSSKNKDTEHSAEEDDIVENTPDGKTNRQLNNLTRESSTISSVFKITDRNFPKTPSSAASINSVPSRGGSITPLYHSTPKVHQTSTAMKYNCALESATIKPNETRRLCFVCSNLVASQVEQVKILARMTGATYLTKFEKQVSHVIVKVDEATNMGAKTLKYLQGIAHRKWVVGYQWVIDSLKEKKLANEERYEAVDSGTLEAGARKSRLRKKDLFEGFAFLCIGPYDNVSVEEYQDLLRATGATVLDSLDALAAAKTKLKIIMTESEAQDYEIIEWYRETRAVPINHDWVVECISQYRLISFYPYLQELSRQDVLELGYPHYLVEETIRDHDST